MIILNKVDLVDGGQLGKIKAWLDDRFDRYRLIEASHCDVPLPALLSVGRLDAARLDAGSQGDPERCTVVNCQHQHHLDHSKAFSTWSYETDGPLSLEALREAASRLPANIFRAKGVIYTADEPGRRVVLQVVGRRVDLSLQGPWNGRIPHTKIVAIGAPGAIDPVALHTTFQSCLATR